MMVVIEKSASSFSRILKVFASVCILIAGFIWLAFGPTPKLLSSGGTETAHADVPGGGCSGGCSGGCVGCDCGSADAGCE